MAFLDDRTIILVVILLIFVIVVLIELRHIRRKRKLAPKKEPLEDQAFNALLSARAISSTLARDGTDLSGVNNVLSEADQALKGKNYRVTLELTDRAKEMMKTIKARSEAPPKSESEEEFVETDVTTKEMLKDKFADNYLESRFSRSLAAEAIEEAKSANAEVSEAERLLGLCDDCVEGEDYTQALSFAVQSKKSAEDAISAGRGEVAEKAAVSQECPSCESGIVPEDAFCRKCGTKLVTGCSSCGKRPEEGDVFCRSCGSKLES
jgi:hypothetical protein